MTHIVGNPPLARFSRALLVVLCEMIRSRRLGDACFQALVAISQAFIAVVAGVAVAFALWSCPFC